MGKSLYCAILGHSPMRFAWSFDEADAGCKELKLELLRQIMTLRMQGVTQFCVACDPGMGLYAAEGVNLLRESKPELQLYCATPQEERATKWAPYLRERYFTMLEKCTYMAVASQEPSPTAQLAAYKRIIDRSDIMLAVCDAAAACGDDVDKAIGYAAVRRRPIIRIHPDSFAVTALV